MGSEILYIGHRGTRTIFDENTIEAFKKAIEFRAEYIEFDVRKTKDKEFIILHDSSLDRTTNGTGLIKNFDYYELKKYRTKNHNCTIPLLSELLEELKGEVKFMIELKEDDIADGILKIVKSLSVFEECIFSGRNLIDLQNINWIIRLKNFYDVPRETVMTTIVPGGFNLNKEIINNIYSSQNVSSILGEFVKSSYPGLSTLLSSKTSDMSSRLLLIQRILEEIMKQEVQHILLGYPFTIGIILSYFILKRNELRKIRIILNAKQYGIQTERIESMI